jgi:hypothetical protein
MHFTQRARTTQETRRVTPSERLGQIRDIGNEPHLQPGDRVMVLGKHFSITLPLHSLMTVAAVSAVKSFRRRMPHRLGRDYAARVVNGSATLPVVDRDP